MKRIFLSRLHVLHSKILHLKAGADNLLRQGLSNRGSDSCTQACACIGEFLPQGFLEQQGQILVDAAGDGDEQPFHVLTLLLRDGTPLLSYELVMLLHQRLCLQRENVRIQMHASLVFAVISSQA